MTPSFISIFPFQSSRNNRPPLPFPTRRSSDLLNHPERFAAAASLSGAVDLLSMDLSLGDPTLEKRIWGEADLRGTADDLLGLLRTQDPTALPSLFLDCGTEDQLVEQNRRFIAAADERGVDLVSRLRPGDHDWGFWDEGIQDVLDWLPVRA